MTLAINPGDGPGLTKVGGGIGTHGSHARQVDDGSTASPAPSWIDSVPTIRTMWIVDDVGTTLGPFTTGTTGTGAAAAVTGESTHPAYRSPSTGTTSTGRCSRGYQQTIIFDTNGHVWRSDSKLRVPTLSNGTDAFAVSNGFTDNVAAIAAVDGAYVSLDSNAAANFQCTVVANSVATTVDSGVACVAGTWYRVLIVVTNATKVEFYVYAEGSAFPASPTVTISTNIPSTITRATAQGTVCIKSLGTTARQVDIAYTQVDQDRLAA